jgi:DNA-binding IclR family transcriptional regulator
LAAGGRLIGALSVSGLITRFGEDRRAELIHALNESRARLEPQLAS